MLTRLLKVFLCSILIGIVLWGGVILLGPPTIKFVVQKYYKENVSIIGLTISPKLKIQASRVEFNDFLIPGLGKKSGFLRAASISLKKVSGGRFFLALSTGPIELNDVAKVSTTSAVVSAEFFGFSDEIEIKLDLKQLNALNGVSIEEFSGDGVLDVKNYNLNEVSYDAQKLSYMHDQDILVNGVSGEIEQFNLTSPIHKSMSNFSVVMEQILSDDGNFKIAQVFIEGMIEASDRSISVVFSDVELKNEGAAKKISLKWTGHDPMVSPIKLLSYEAHELHLIGGKMKPLTGFVGNIGGIIDFNDSTNIEVTAVGKIGNYDLRSGSQFIADLSDSDIRLDMTLHSNGERAAIKTEFVLDLSLNPIVAISGLVALTVNDKNIFLCAISGCELNKIEVNYVVQAGDASLNGSSKCDSGACSFQSSNHLVYTSDTNKFFAVLMESRSFNPMVLVYGKSQLEMGAQIGAGHKLNF